MKEFSHFLSRNKIYILMLAFILLFNVADFLLPAIREYNQQKEEMLKIQQDKIKEEVKVREDAIIKNINENQQLQRLAGILSFFFAFMLLAGLGLLITFIRLKFRHREPLLRISSLPPPKWGILDAVRIAIVFVFFNYMLFLVIATMEKIFGVSIKNPSNKAVFNTFIMDFLALGFIFYFLFIKFGQHLNAVGLRIKDFLQNAFLGLLGYMAFLPVLVAVVFISYYMGNYFNIEPQSQPLFDLFMEEQRVFVLIILTLFVVAIGPIIEEIFFRGFLYSAFKKRFSAFSGMLLTSLIFAGLHMNALGFLPILALAFVLVYMFEKTGSLVPSIIIHCAHNGMIVILLFLARFFSGNF